MSDTPPNVPPKAPPAPPQREFPLGYPPFALHIGIRITSAAPDRVEAEMLAAPDLINGNGVLHGGAIMALADNIGGLGAYLNVGEGETTTTVESKTNFFRAVPRGDLVTAVSIPLHRGRTMQVWQTSLYRADGQLAAMVTQTQMTILPR